MDRNIGRNEPASASLRSDNQMGHPGALAERTADTSNYSITLQNHALWGHEFRQPCCCEQIKDRMKQLALVLSGHCIWGSGVRSSTPERLIAWALCRVSVGSIAAPFSPGSEGPDSQNAASWSRNFHAGRSMRWPTRSPELAKFWSANQALTFSSRCHPGAPGRLIPSLTARSSQHSS